MESGTLYSRNSPDTSQTAITQTKVPFKESSPGSSDPRPDTYDEYKQEKGADLKARDLASYFNGEMHTAVLQLENMKIAVKRSAMLEEAEREQMLKRINKMEEKLQVARSIANDTFQLLWRKEEHH